MWFQLFGVTSGALGKVSQTEAEIVTVVVRTIGLCCIVVWGIIATNLSC